MERPSQSYPGISNGTSKIDKLKMFNFNLDFSHPVRPDGKDVQPVQSVHDVWMGMAIRIVPTRRNQNHLRIDPPKEFQVCRRLRPMMGGFQDGTPKRGIQVEQLGFYLLGNVSSEQGAHRFVFVPDP
jgi:hypothetical protein